MKAEAVAEGVYCASDRLFRRRVFFADAAHVKAAPLGGQAIHHVTQMITCLAA